MAPPKTLKKKIIRLGWILILGAFGVAFILGFRQVRSEQNRKATSYKVYVMLGFHASFYHSWRGDTPDEAGFGTDIRIVREIIKTLNRANEEGLKARGYWDFDIYWTLQNIIPQYAPDIIEGVRQRVQSGQDEVMPGPYNNGANHAATEEEFRTALSYALENPFGSGLKQVFGKITPIFRPQESMYTAGQNAILLEEGYSGFVLYYSGIPFDSIGAFVKTLPPEQRYNPFWLRNRPEEPPVVVLPSISPGDLVENVSLEKMLIDMHQLQVSGKVKSDLLIHMNFDADSDTWLPLNLPKIAAWFPNTGGLEEYIRSVNKYPWAEFTVPGEYLSSHAPQGEVLVRQDLADGGFDGNYSWAEKFKSIENWSMLERSRLYSYRAMELAKRLPASTASEIERRLWEGPESSFFQRLVGLTTTHFGMSTPVINEERQAKAEQVIGAAQVIAETAEKEAAQAVRSQAGVTGDALYVFEAYNYARGKHAEPKPVQSIVRLPILLPPGVENIQVTAAGEKVHASLVNLENKFVDGSRAAELIFVDQFGPEERKTYQVSAVPFLSNEKLPNPVELKNQWLDLHLSDGKGLESFTFQGQQIGGPRFLEPFITYRSAKKPQSWFASDYSLDHLASEARDGLVRAKLNARIRMDTPSGPYDSQLAYTFTMFDNLPYLLVDVQADYAATSKQDVIHNLQQKLRRLLDLRWIEVAPFQLNPEITASPSQPLRVWKHNYLNITSYYDLNYGQINPKNKDLDSFNHQVTAGWVAISNGERGLLLAENTQALTSLAFCPMRLREAGGVQRASLNPFGSYYGRQFDYSHLGGSGIGAEFATAVSGSLKPNGPSYNGEVERFSLLLAPYLGDEPPTQMQEDALAFFYPMGVIYLKAPQGIEVVTPEDMKRLIEIEQKKAQQISNVNPLSPPTAILANPSDQSADLVWDPPRDERITGYEISWQAAGETGWRIASIAEGDRWHISGLENGKTYNFQMRAMGHELASISTAQVSCVPGPVKGVSLASALPSGSTWTLVRLVFFSLVEAVRAFFY